MSKVPVPKHIAEAIISHSGGKSRLDATYDLYEYFDEKTDALTKWSDWVDAITVDHERCLHPVTTQGKASTAPKFLPRVDQDSVANPPSPKAAAVKTLLPTSR